MGRLSRGRNESGPKEICRRNTIQAERSTDFAEFMPDETPGLPFPTDRLNRAFSQLGKTVRPSNLRLNHKFHDFPRTPKGGHRERFGRLWAYELWTRLGARIHLSLYWSFPLVISLGSGVR
jgi:hypothetical protein